MRVQCRRPVLAGSMVAVSVAVVLSILASAGAFPDDTESLTTTSSIVWRGKIGGVRTRDGFGRSVAGSPVTGL